MVYFTLSLFRGREEGMNRHSPWSTSGSSRAVLGRMIFGGQATSPVECDHVSGIVKSGAVPFLLHCCSVDM